MAAEKQFLSKMNLVLVGILKHEWPHHWPEFITEIVNASMSNEILCENNMHILKLLSEEVYNNPTLGTATPAPAVTPAPAPAPAPALPPADTACAPSTTMVTMI